jgi:hypothetical protein
MSGYDRQKNRHHQQHDYPPEFSFDFAHIHPTFDSSIGKRSDIVHKQPHFSSMDDIKKSPAQARMLNTFYRVLIAG